jgi:hypothetical protein
VTQWIDLQTTDSFVGDYYKKVGEREHTFSTGAPGVVAATSIGESKVDCTPASALSSTIADNEGVPASAIDMSGRLRGTSECVYHDQL